MPHSVAPSFRRSPRRRDVLVCTVLLGLGFATSCRLGALRMREGVTDARADVAARLDHLRADLSRELFGALNLPHGLFGLVSLRGTVNEAEFEGVAATILERSPLIRDIALAPGNVVRFVYPKAGNEAALGLDYIRSPGQADAVLRAINERRTVVAGPVMLAQGGLGIVGRTPIFLRTSPGASPALAYWGMASTVIDFEKLIAGVGLRRTGLRIVLQGANGTGATGPVFWGDPAVLEGQPVSLDVPLPAGSWRIAAVPQDGWPQVAAYRSTEFAFGSLLSIAVTALLFHALRVSRERRIEVEERVRTELSLRRANRALQLLIRANGAVARTTDEADLFREVCRLAVKVAGYPLAWVGRAERDEASTVRPVAFAGPGETFLRELHISWADGPAGRGAAGTAIRTRRPSIAHDIAHDPNFSLWRSRIDEFDFQSAVGIPIGDDEGCYGVLVVYAREADAFDATEVELLADLGRNISHGLSDLRARDDRNEAIAALERARSELEDRVAERTRQLVAAKEAAESADRTKSAFLANMSHELRTPLNSIIGFTGIVLQGLAGPLNDEQRKQLSMVQASGRHLLALISDVLDLSKIQAGQLKVRCDRFDLAQAIRQTVEAVRPQLDRKQLSLALDIAPEVGEITGDRRRTEQVLLNLLSNAIKFTDQGTIAVRGCTVGHWVKLEVADTGMGIEPSQRHLLFRPFSQIDTGLARRHEGTGLGLSICRHLVELMGGTIDVESQPGIGTTFFVMVPLAPRSARSGTEVT
jgi:signal transduction histidine kinase/sensor domain CHASE-containing protein